MACRSGGSRVSPSSTEDVEGRKHGVGNNLGSSLHMAAMITSAAKGRGPESELPTNGEIWRAALREIGRRSKEQLCIMNKVIT